MAGLATLRDALIDEIRNLYSAEQQLLVALPKLVKAASNADLREDLVSHLAETSNHVIRLERVFHLLDEKTRGTFCAGMAGILEDGADMLERADGAVLDACIIAAAQRAEHYEMAGYGTAAAWADGLGLSDVVELLRETLAEEIGTDERLTELAETGINADAGADAAENEVKPH